MSDTRTRRQKLEAMARQTVSPNEAEIARRKLAAMPGPEPFVGSGPEGLFDDYTRASTQASADMMAFAESLRRMYEQMGRDMGRDLRQRPYRREWDRRDFHDFTPGSGRACGTCGLTRSVGYHTTARERAKSRWEESA